MTLPSSTLVPQAVRLACFAVVFALLPAPQATARPDLGGPSSFSGPETSAGEEPILFAKEAVQRAVFDNCFLAGTNVETASRGDVNIEDVRLGDRFAPPPGHSCEDPRCGEVVRLFPGQTDQVVTITAVVRPRAREHRASGSGEESGGDDAEPPSASQTIHCTPGHPFFVEGRGWVFAGDLRAGDELEARGERVIVESVEVRAERAETFNFEVACHHTYRVSGAAGEPAVLVHNRSWASAIRGANWSRAVRGLGTGGGPRAFRSAGVRGRADFDAATRGWGLGATKSQRAYDAFQQAATSRGTLPIGRLADTYGDGGPDGPLSVIGPTRPARPTGPLRHGPPPAVPAWAGSVRWARPELAGPTREGPTPTWAATRTWRWAVSVRGPTTMK